LGSFITALQVKT